MTASELTRVGLIGGTSWESTLVYYRLLNQAIRARVGGQASAPVTIWSVDFSAIEALQRADDWPAQGVILADAARRLESAGCRAVAVAANTLHLLAEDISAAVTVPFVDLIDLARDACAGYDTVGLLATGYTMRADLYPSRFAPAGTKVLVPDEAGQQLVHEIIYRELTQGIVRDESRTVLLAQIAALVERGAQAVILGCTELDLILSAGDADVLLVDTTALHCTALADIMINGVSS